MTKEFVPFELAVKLKQIGFDEPCLDFYDDNQELFYNHENKEKIHIGDSVKAPLFQQAFRWFRDNYRLSVFIQDWLDDYDGEIVEWTIGEDRIIYEITNRTDTYEEAEIYCLNKLIELVETKQQEQWNNYFKR
jgi:hypothetical protein